jgi:glycosyltransferase involved in cell wall biosynthesis
VQHRCYRDSLGASAAAAATLAVSRRARVWTEAVSAYIAPTESVRDIVVSSGVAGNRPVWVKPHAVSDVAARPAPPSQSRKVLFVGRLVETKGVDVLLDAWSLAEPELELVVVGDGPLRAAMEASPRPGVSFTGYLPNPAVRDLMRESRALAFPAVSEEVFGCAVVEAMSAGLPVLATDRGGPARLTRPVGEEWLVAVGDVQAWANALRRLEDPGVVDTGGAAARQEYERRYRPEASANALVEIYESVQRPAAMRQGL